MTSILGGNTGTPQNYEVVQASAKLETGLKEHGPGGLVNHK